MCDSRGPHSALPGWNAFRKALYTYMDERLCEEKHAEGKEGIMDGAKTKPKPSVLQRSSKLSVLLLLLGTNLLTLLFFSGPFHRYSSSEIQRYLSQNQNCQCPFPSSPSNQLWANLNQTQRELLDVKADLQSSRHLADTLIAQLAQILNGTDAGSRGTGTDDDSSELQEWGSGMPNELKEFLAEKKLPLGFNPAMGSDTLLAAVGHACGSPPLRKDLAAYMEYKRGDECPEDEILAQKLMLRGCEPLPRRRCYPKTPANYTEPFPFPECMWKTPPDSSVVWTAYTCKNYGCLIDRKYSKAFDDCKDCFDLEWREKLRWLPGDPGSLRFSIDEVLRTKNGSIRIGLDIGGGAGTFAVRMRERNVTVMTTSMNFNGPFNTFIASRGVVPLYITVSQRMPFFDNTLDIVHSMHVLSSWIPTQLLEFILYDIYRILRPGGLFWLDHFFCVENQYNSVYVPIFEALPFKKLRWIAGRKWDSSPSLPEMYVSALLEKPLRT